MSTKALAKTTWVLILVIIVLVAALVGVIVYSGVLTKKSTTTSIPTPSFVTNNVFVWEGADKPQWLDPDVSYYEYDFWIMQHSLEMLLWYNGSSSTQIIPWLTASWAPNYTVPSLSYTVTLRKGITFQDGYPLNSTAVWFSLNRLLILDGTAGDNSAHGTQAAWIVQQLLNTGLSSYFSGTQSYNSTWVKEVLAQNFIQIINATTFKINVMKETTQFPYLFSQPWAAIISPWSVIPQEYAYNKWGTWDGNMTDYFVKAAGGGVTYYDVPTNGWKIGTGPYYMASYDPTTYKVVLLVNPNYWGGPTNAQYPIGTPKIKEIDFDYVADFSTRLLDLKGGVATEIGVSSADLYSVANQTAWVESDTLESIVPGATIHGPYTQFVTDWFNFITNVTSSSGGLLKFQPMADIRIREALCDAVNLTEINIDVNNKMGQVANQLIPPGTAPAGSYNASIKLQYSYNLTEAAILIVDAMKHPLTSFTYENGTAIPPGVVDNSFGASNPQTIPIYYISGDTLDEKLLTELATNINTIAITNNTGLTVTLVPVPGGEQYTLEAEHLIYMNWGGWVADYNNVLDWLNAMYFSTGTYPAWNNMNYTTLDTYVKNARQADATGNVTALLHWNYLANQFGNNECMYLYDFYPLEFTVTSSFLKGWYFNSALDIPIWSSMYYSTTS